MTNATGTHHFVPDPRNAEVMIDVNGEHVPRPQASVSVFDSGFMLGDGVWEGLRVHQGEMSLGVSALLLESATLIYSSIHYWIARRGGRPVLYSYGKLQHIAPDRLAAAES